MSWSIFDGRAPPSRTARRNERSIVLLSVFVAAIMEKVVECPVVKHPPFRGQVPSWGSFSVVEKCFVLVMLLKFDQRKIVPVRQGTHFLVITFADRPRNTDLIIKLTVERRTEQKRLSMNLLQGTQ
jgi:hypothetical protein